MARSKTSGQGRKKGSKNKAGLIPYELKKACQDVTQEVVDVWIDVLRDKEQPGAVRVQAGERLMERGYGKPQQGIDITSHNAIDDLTAEQLIELGAAIASGLARLGVEDPGGAPGAEAGIIPSLRQAAVIPPGRAH